MAPTQDCSGPESYFDAGEAQFRALTSTRRARDYRIAGLRLRIVATEALDHALSKAIAHLEAEASPDEPDLLVSAWDSVSTDSSPLKPSWSRDDIARDGTVTRFCTKRFHTVISYHAVPIFTMLDRTRRRALYWTRDARDLPFWELGGPMRPLLLEWLKGRGIITLHAGAVGFPDGGVLLGGAGGRGKSNLALSCLDSPLFYASDDFCAVSGPEWEVHSLYCSGKLAEADLVRHPYLAPHIAEPPGRTAEKLLFLLAGGYGHKLIASMPLKAVVLPQVDRNAKTAIAPARGSDVQRAIAISTIQLSPWTGTFTFAAVAQMIRALPCYKLQIGEDYLRAPTLLADLLAELRQPGREASP